MFGVWRSTLSQFVKHVERQLQVFITYTFQWGSYHQIRSQSIRSLSSRREWAEQKKHCRQQSSLLSLFHQSLWSRVRIFRIFSNFRVHYMRALWIRRFTRPQSTLCVARQQPCHSSVPQNCTILERAVRIFWNLSRINALTFPCFCRNKVSLDSSNWDAWRFRTQRV